MGNQSLHYMAPREAEELLGEAGAVLRAHLERLHRKTIDAPALARLFSRCAPSAGCVSRDAWLAADSSARRWTSWRRRC